MSSTPNNNPSKNASQKEEKLIL